MSKNDNETEDDSDDEDEMVAPVTDIEAKSVIETLERYLRQKEDCRPDIGSMKLSEIKLFVNNKNINSRKQSSIDRFLNKE